MLQKLQVNDFEWIENTSQVSEDLIKVNNEIFLDIFLKLMFSILKNSLNFIMIYHLPEKMKIEKVEPVAPNLHY